MRYDAIHLWGDSIAKGVVFDEARKRYCITPERCTVGLEKALQTPILNHSRMGATIADGYADFMQAEAQPGALVVVEFGGNDCDMPWAEISENPQAQYDGRVPLGDFTSGLHQFVQSIRARQMTPLLVTPPPLDAERYFAWVTQGLSADAVLRFLGDVQHIYRWQERYAIAVRKAAHALRCALFDMRDALLAQQHYPQMLCADGIHLNAKGHSVVVDAVMAERETLTDAAS